MQRRYIISFLWNGWFQECEIWDSLQLIDVLFMCVETINLILETALSLFGNSAKSRSLFYRGKYIRIYSDHFRDMVVKKGTGVTHNVFRIVYFHTEVYMYVYSSLAE